MPAADTYSFNDLINHFRDHKGEPAMPSEASLSNVVSALKSFAVDEGHALNRPIGSALRVSFYRKRDAHLERLRARGEAKTYVHNRSHALGFAHRALLHLDRAQAAEEGRVRPLAAALQAVAAELSVKGLTHAIGMPLATFNRWKDGATPQARSMHYLDRIERHLGMVPGTLSNLAPHSATPGSVVPTTPIAYRSRLGRLSRIPYAMTKEGATADFKSEWTDLVRFRTSALATTSAEAASPMARTWWKVERSVGDPARCDWTNSIRGRKVPTAMIQFGVVSRFFGWLQMPIEQGGCGFAAGQAQTLATFTNLQLLDDYITWHIGRADGKVNPSIEMILIVAAALCHPAHGFLIGRRDIGKKAGFADVQQWRDHCARAHSAIVAERKRRKTEIEQSRNPFEPIATILALDTPLDAIADAVERLDADRPHTGGTAEAVWARDKTLLLLTSCVPLRLRNLKDLRISDLHKDINGVLRVKLPSVAFKNVKGAAGTGTFDMPLNPEVSGFVERYLRIFRPVLADPDNDRVFVSRTNPHGVWESLSRHFFTLSRRYCVDCPGFGVHGMRHIVATHLVKQTGGYAAAARALNDSEDTVKQHYGRFLSADAASWLAKTAVSAFRRMGRHKK